MFDDEVGIDMFDGELININGLDNIKDSEIDYIDLIMEWNEEFFEFKEYSELQKNNLLSRIYNEIKYRTDKEQLLPFSKYYGEIILSNVNDYTDSSMHLIILISQHIGEYCEYGLEFLHDNKILRFIQTYALMKKECALYHQVLADAFILTSYFIPQYLDDFLNNFNFISIATYYALKEVPVLVADKSEQDEEEEEENNNIEYISSILSAIDLLGSIFDVYCSIRYNRLDEIIVRIFNLVFSSIEEYADDLGKAKHRTIDGFSNQIATPVHCLSAFSFHFSQQILDLIDDQKLLALIVIGVDHRIIEINNRKYPVRKWVFYILSNFIKSQPNLYQSITDSGIFELVLTSLPHDTRQFIDEDEIASVLEYAFNVFHLCQYDEDFESLIFDFVLEFNNEPKTNSLIKHFICRIINDGTTKNRNSIIRHKVIPEIIKNSSNFNYRDIEQIMKSFIVIIEYGINHGLSDVLKEQFLDFNNIVAEMNEINNDISEITQKIQEYLDEL